MTYDDERVVALLKESVPAVPDVPGRVDAVRRLAGRQRTFAQVQVLGAAASMVLVVAAVAAFVRPGGTDEVRAVRDPARVMRTALERAGSYRFEVTTAVEQEGKPAEVDTMRGAATADDSVYVIESAPREGRAEYRVRVVGGYAYRSPAPGEVLPPGKRWVRMPASEWNERVSDFGKGRDGEEPEYRFVRSTTLDGVGVAEYEALTGPGQGMTSTSRITVALDAKGRTRRMVVVSEAAPLRITMTITYSGFGEPVHVEPPPADEVVDLALVTRVP